MTLNKNITSAYTNENLKLGKNKGTDSLYYTPLVDPALCDAATPGK